MPKNQSFPTPGCNACPHYEVVGGITRYCNGFKRKKAKHFRSTDPKLKAPTWCPKRISPPIYRIYGYADECGEYMEIMRRMDYDMGRTETIFPSASHYKPRTELCLGMTARQFFDKAQEEPLSDILPEEVHRGEIIEIDDGLQPYFFYVLGYSTIISLPYFHLTRGEPTQ